LTWRRGEGVRSLPTRATPTPPPPPFRGVGLVQRRLRLCKAVFIRHRGRSHPFSTTFGGD
jgi:hypothetical protein